MPPFTTKIQKNMSLLSLSPSMEDFPENVMVDILSRLPVKTIIHCKCVCKKWLDLVSDSYFANLHLSRSPSSLMIHRRSEKEMSNGYRNPGILKWLEVEDELDHHNLHHDPVMCLDLNLAPIFQNSPIHPVGSVNGLICLWQYSYIADNTYICNPITREYMILPRPRQSRDVNTTMAYGFGVGLLTREYKVIRIFRGKGTSTSEAEVYTVGTGQWRSLGHVPYCPNRIFGPFLNGHAHWTVGDNNSSSKICAFDFDTETFELFPSPPSEPSIQGRRFKSHNLGMLKGCLCRCDTYSSEFVIWVMKEYGIKNSWHKEVMVKQGTCPDLYSLSLLRSGSLHLIEGLKDGTIFMVSFENKLLAYCPQRNIIVDTKIFDRIFHVSAYRPSFLKLKNLDLLRVHVF